MVLGEQEVVDFRVTDADDIVDLIPVIVTVEAVAELRGLGVMELAVTAGEGKAAVVVDQMPSPTR